MGRDGVHQLERVGASRPTEGRQVRPEKRLYSAAEIDLVLVYIPQVDRVAAFGPKHFEGKTALIVRLEPPKNGQQKNLHMLQDFLW